MQISQFVLNKRVVCNVQINQMRSETTRASQLLQQMLNIASVSFCGLGVHFLCMLLVNVAVVTLCESNIVEILLQDILIVYVFFPPLPGNLIASSTYWKAMPNIWSLQLYTMFLLGQCFCSLNHPFLLYFLCLLEQLKPRLGPLELTPLSKTITPRRTTAPQ